MNKLTPEQVIFTYNKISGTDYAINSKQVSVNVIREIINESWKRTEDGSTYEYLNIQSKAAVMCLKLAKQKPFPDNNLKTAILAAITMLELNNRYIKLDETSIHLLAWLLNNGDTTYIEIADWFKAHTVKSLE